MKSRTYLILAFAFSMMLGLFQNCGNVGLAPAPTPEEKLRCEDRHVYEIYVPSGSSDLQLQLTRDGNPFTDILDWNGIRSLPATPICDSVNEVVVTYRNSCEESVTIDRSFIDPRCVDNSPPPPSTIPPTTLPPSNQTITIPGSNLPPAPCSPESPASTTLVEPPIPQACGQFISVQNNRAQVNLPYTETPAKPYSQYANGWVTRNTRYNFMDHSCTGLSNPNSFYNNGGFDKREFVSMRLDTATRDTGALNIYGFAAGGANTPRNVLVTISECPGDFGEFKNINGVEARTLKYYSGHMRALNQQKLSARYSQKKMDQCVFNFISGDGGASVYWSTKTDAPWFYCHLDPSKTYYVNMVFRSPDTLEPSCPRAGDDPNIPNCGFKLIE